MLALSGSMFPNSLFFKTRVECGHSEDVWFILIIVVACLSIILVR